MTIRSLSEADARTVQAWLRDFLKQHRADWARAYGVAPQSALESLVERDWQELSQVRGDERNFVRVATDTSPVGVVSAALRQDAYMGIELGVLSWIYVAPEARGRGVADELMRAAKDWMRQQEVQGLEVFVICTNRAAIKLYERHGFQATDSRMLGRL